VPFLKKLVVVVVGSSGGGIGGWWSTTAVVVAAVSRWRWYIYVVDIYVVFGHRAAVFL
jgi:hypothetical protein